MCVWLWNALGKFVLQRQRQRSGSSRDSGSSTVICVGQGSHYSQSAIAEHTPLGGSLSTAGRGATEALTGQQPRLTKAGRNTAFSRQSLPICRAAPAPALESSGPGYTAQAQLASFCPESLFLAPLPTITGYSATISFIQRKSNLYSTPLTAFHRSPVSPEQHSKFFSKILRPSKDDSI